MVRKAQTVFKDGSLANLRPREPMYGEAKKRRELLATGEGWEGFKALASAHGLSASELVERLGRGLIPLPSAQPPDHGDTLELSITKWGIDTGQGVDANGQRYAVKRLKDAH